MCSQAAHGGNYQPLLDTFEERHKRKNDGHWENEAAATAHVRNIFL